MQVDTAATGTVSRQRGWTSEGGHAGKKAFAVCFFPRIDSAGPPSASMSPGWWDNWKN